jgi:mono/diheme cytochrome c family protein
LVVYIPILAALLALLTVGAMPAESRQSCVSCHNSHYADRGQCTDCHRGNPLSDRKNIAHYRLIGGLYAHFTIGETPAVKNGKRLMDQLACRRCHQSNGYGNQLASSLDMLIDSKPPSAIAESIRKPVTGMPDFLLEENGVTALVNAIFSASGSGIKRRGEQPMVRHFDKTATMQQDVFAVNCGACHRMLSVRKGLTGRGDAGPNLSGLLTRFYPASLGDGKRWTFAALQSWLKNPRQVKPNAVMKPVRLDSDQLKELKFIIGSE